MTTLKPQQQLANKFELRYGTDDLLKVCVSTINKLLVDKGICTEDELKDMFADRVDKAITEIKQMNGEHKNSG